MSKPIEIKVKGCDSCPFWEDSIDKIFDSPYCKHTSNMYDGKQSDEFIEHCPLKERDTIIKFEREDKNTIDKQ